MATNPPRTRHVVVRVPEDLHQQARHRLVDDDHNFQQVLLAAIEQYVAGDWTPAKENAR